MAAVLWPGTPDRVTGRIHWDPDPARVLLCVRRMDIMMTVEELVALRDQVAERVAEAVAEAERRAARIIEAAELTLAAQAAKAEAREWDLRLELARLRAQNGMNVHSAAPTPTPAPAPLAPPVVQTVAVQTVPAQTVRTPVPVFIALPSVRETLPATYVVPNKNVQAHVDRLRAAFYGAQRTRAQA